MRWMSLLFCVCSCLRVEAQLLPVDTIRDVGQVSEDSLLLRHSFFIRNQGKLLLQIDTVYEDCACVVVDWPREPVLPAAEAAIRIQYDLRNELGSFEKVFRVVGDGGSYEQRLILRGEVVPGRARAARLYPIHRGPLRMLSEVLNFGEVMEVCPGPCAFFVYNTGKDSLRFRVKDLPRHLEMDFLPEVLPPLEVGRWLLRYRPWERSSRGYQLDELGVVLEATQGGGLTEVMCLVAATQHLSFLDPSIGKGVWMTEGEEKPAQLSFESSFYDFRRVKSKEILVATFPFKNRGEGVLRIQQIRTFCDYIYVEERERLYEPGEEGEVASSS